MRMAIATNYSLLRTTVRLLLVYHYGGWHFACRRSRVRRALLLFHSLCRSFKTFPEDGSHVPVARTPTSPR